ncbi:glycosyltransferase family 22 protein [Wickerhamomyces anomalus NRRL Y-366-8]|uniref:Mannosyltransferase n=1 Tax=Wickerhamomyces anomalus (strain ATCC 58044 / CBS 1984 / NCYC 433 / NRRL Y-366-8) TaxID=683960 RepID=A0A1E3P3T1_WICAA|nr:glycosyltransferase family 22 protein [Wickerhamomyces anomalus NRRL Y-366-8]ODQ60139.1 glycosyltransferase family 22 protein [Wickerhamomyces anomalus NRRL Y-366-8]
MADWKTFHYISYALLFYFALEPSYIHPDEHFQSFEVLTNKFYNYKTNIPWEFSSNPSRSYAVLYLIYGPLLYINKLFKFNPLALLYIARLQLVVSYIFIAQWSTRIITQSKQEGSKTIYFIFSSYVTWTYQSHTFSNSIETQILLIALSILHILKLQSNLKNPTRSNGLIALLGIVMSLGIFNRITFVAFLFIPSFFLLKHFQRFKSTAITFTVFFTITSLILILLDTKLFGSDHILITPLNNFLYNKDSSNLAQHGLHPYYTHLLINLPQLAGPVLIPLLYKNRYTTSIPFLSIVSGLFILSVIPHQELRFLTPLVPLICMCIDFQNISPAIIVWTMRLWCVFNLVFGVIMGSLHQRGVLVTLDHLREVQYGGVQIWWKTYKPPAYILANQNLTISEKDVIHNTDSNHMIDLMGADVNSLAVVLEKFDQSLLITPRSSIPLLERLNNTFSIEKIWSYDYHLDLDHLDFEDFRTLRPGIDVYNITQLI